MKLFESFLNRNDIQYEKKGNSISFVFDEKSFLLLLDVKDPNYYRLTLPKVGDGSIDRKELNSILVRLTSEFKVGKTIDTTVGGIWFSYEQLLMSEKIEDCEYVFSRSIIILSKMLKRYREMIQEFKGGASIQGADENREQQNAPSLS